MLLRCAGYRGGTGTCAGGYDAPYMASDAWSIIVKEVVKLYSGQLGRCAVGAAESQYADYAISSSESFRDWLDKKTDYWKKKLEGVTPLPVANRLQQARAGSTCG